MPGAVPWTQRNCSNFTCLLYEGSARLYLSAPPNPCPPITLFSNGQELIVSNEYTQSQVVNYVILHFLNTSNGSGRNIK